MKGIEAHLHFSTLRSTWSKRCSSHVLSRGLRRRLAAQPWMRTIQSKFGDHLLTLIEGDWLQWTITWIPSWTIKKQRLILSTQKSLCRDKRFRPLKLVTSVTKTAAKWRGSELRPPSILIRGGSKRKMAELRQQQGFIHTNYEISTVSIHRKSKLNSRGEKDMSLWSLRPSTILRSKGTYKPHQNSGSISILRRWRWTTTTNPQASQPSHPSTRR